jgi:polysaccharide biosynthesis/export protein
VLAVACGLLTGCGNSSDSPLPTALGDGKAVTQLAPSATTGATAVTAATSTARVGSVGSQPVIPASAVSGAAVPKAQNAQLASVADKYLSRATPTSAAYLIGYQDVLEITVFKVPDLSRSVHVSETGTVNFPLVGEVVAAGRPASDLERELVSRLGAKYLQSPQVNVTVKEYNSQRVTVDGAVAKPGVYPMRGGLTLVQIIAMSSGLTEVADSELVIFREKGGQRFAAKYELDDIRAGKLTDPPLEAGDVVVVNTSASKAAFQNVLKVLPVASFARILF